MADLSYDDAYEAYMLFRMTEAEHITRYKRKSLYPEWVEQSANPEYERALWDAYPGNKSVQ